MRWNTLENSIVKELWEAEGITFSEFCSSKSAVELRELFYPADDIDNEEFRNVIVPDGLLEDYSVSRRGVVLSHKYTKTKRIAWSVRDKGRKYPNVTLSHNSVTNFAPTVRHSVHKLVALTFWEEVKLPDYMYEAGWNTWSAELKFKFLSDVLVIDHIDQNSWNPHVTNLHFTDSASNTRSGNKGNSKIQKTGAYSQ